ncbi:MAG: hypothetical protein ACC609_09070 [Methanobacterium formicicum]
MIENYDGITFVAYMDICGFKVHMKNGEGFEMLDNFYSESYRILKDYKEKINSIFISDCGMLFVREENSTPKEKLKILLESIKKINKKMLSHKIMLGTSIAYGKFKYQHRIEFEGMSKNNICGNAYLNAFLDAERKGKQKIQPGQCRIVKDKFPIDLSTEDEELFSFLKDRKYYPDNYYFYWTLSSHDEIGSFEKKYKNAYRLREKEGYHLITEVLEDYESYLIKPTP